MLPYYVMNNNNVLIESEIFYREYGPVFSCVEGKFWVFLSNRGLILELSEKDWVGLKNAANLSQNIINKIEGLCA